jgi:hypothetical protein
MPKTLTLRLSDEQASDIEPGRTHPEQIRLRADPLRVRPLPRRLPR